jgi:glycerol-3-phosphate acyltransferase PlsY
VTGSPAAIQLPIATLVGYLLGSVPTGVLICRVLGTPDVRRSGSGHTGGLNVTRSAGFWAGALTAVGDAVKGVLAVSAALWLTANPWAASAAGAAAVIGHNWSVFLQFSGGIGLSTLFGAVLRFAPLQALAALAILLPVWLILMGPLKVHRARATILVMLAVGPVLWAVGMAGSGIVLGMLGALAVIVKTVPDWSRQYVSGI